ncbi:uncharacterized protein NECHADRAFT_86140 [Fusarium vanettenii 77-13-4]|uniref:Metallo-beta-lactamase domain-containing protein n=1 Tax=Fusarium vanettenii (strain ATCC MYA-4622 / CBS 123669 / FGSC 9596 / NRRL 45880 / 77-13-4) TaxID=660122 RepID=C7Z1G1_FUSV7|nr:uncharacterized protein NECHADRAFT_86140 [Fusarium vanettenii 77-13-4]EEU41999.1 hypothetical protein NECHADRAFT_86140 [Fusarium vanettenii 77-13-4]
MSDVDSVKIALEALEDKALGVTKVSALRGGTFTLPKKTFVSGEPDNERCQVPSLSFLIVHQSSAAGPRRILFDLGLRRNTKEYSLPIQNHLQNRLPLQPLPDVRQSLLDGGLSRQDIDEVILSHVHWDHIGTPSDFPQAQFLVRAGSLDVLKNGLNGHMSHSQFQDDLFDKLNVQEFPPPTQHLEGWQEAGGLHVRSLTDDGSIYIVDCPGHLTGHIGLLVRKGIRQWVLLIGDACHDERLLRGEMSIAEWTDADGRICCIHMDKKLATETLAKFSLWKHVSEQCGFDLRIIFAHDATWARNNQDAFYPGAL